MNTERTIGVGITLSAIAFIAAASAAGGTQQALTAACNTPHARAFDFWPGTWDVKSRLRLADGTWRETNQRWHAAEAIDGCAYVDSTAADFGAGFVRGIGLRYFDPATDLWTITWLSTQAPGRLGMWTGKMADGGGDFVSAMSANGTQTRIRWADVRDNAASWSYSVSADSGKTWEDRWLMEFRRTNTR